MRAVVCGLILSSCSLYAQSPGGVGRQSQARYEEGSPDAGYLARVAKAGVNVLYVVIGKS